MNAVRPLVGTSWKMNLTSTEADRWLMFRGGPRHSGGRLSEKPVK
jgi:hypothetical protein